MRGSPVVLTPEQAVLIASTIEDSAVRHGIRLVICAVMSTHVHAYTENETRGGSDQLRLFKGATSRELTRHYGPPSGRWWTKSGSAKPKFDQAERRRALAYVLGHEALAWSGVRAPG